MNETPSAPSSFWRQWLTALITACLFLTRLPMPTLAQITPADQGRSLLCYPLVGWIIGLLLAIAGWLLSDVVPSLPLAALLLGLWVVITGALHIDGLADSADGWLSGASAERTLEIMKDPRCGSAAVAVVSVVLLIKFASLSVLVEHQRWLLLVIIPLLARSSAVLLMLKTPYARPDGIAHNLLAHAPAQTTMAALLFALAGLVLCTSLTQALVLVIATLVITLSLRQLMLKRLQGATGDTVGASIEIVEALLLLIATTL